MATIGETIDLHVPLAVARQKWNEYVTGMVIGSGAGPGEREYPFRWRKDEREADEGAVQFAVVEEGVTRLTVSLQFPQDDEAESTPDELELLRSELRGDLDLYRRYAEGLLRKSA